jgi:SAM-dependent methyltransferase
VSPVRPRRAAALLAVAVACARPGGPASPSTDAEVQAWAAAVFSAYDHGDVPALEAVLADGFVHVDRARVFDRAFTLERTRSLVSAGVAARERVCTDATVQRSGVTATYVATCTVTLAAEGERPAATWIGVHTLVWSTASEPRLVAWTEQPGGVDAERDMWNDIFRRSVGFERAPNRLLVEVAAGLPRGRALDLMMGQGRNAVYLASAGWEVTGVDLSDEGVRLARAAAEAQGVALDAIVADVDRYDLGADRWDLIAMIYAGADPRHLERVRAALKPGGVFVLEYFAAGSATGDNLGGATAAGLAQSFAGWSLLRDEEVEDQADWGADRTRLVRFVARKPTGPAPR